VTHNEALLTEKMLPSLRHVVGADKVKEETLITGAEDFSFYQQKIPGMYFFVGSTPADQDRFTAPANHSDYFFVDEKSIPVAIRAMTQVAVDFLDGAGNR
jgi:metal-dependent amidase/aminoacylase/carboxypeptidase family protein